MNRLRSRHSEDISNLSPKNLLKEDLSLNAQDDEKVMVDCGYLTTIAP